MKRIPLTKPFITDALKRRVCETLDSHWITQGPATKALEGALRSAQAAPVAEL